MLKFYFSGHNFEYEARNALRVFDLNIDYNVNIDGEEPDFQSEFSIVSTLEEQEGIFKSTAILYCKNEKIFEKSFKSNEIILEKENDKKMKKTLVTKSIHNVLKKQRQYGRSDAEITRILKKTYEVTDEKIELLWDILKIEEKYIDEETNKNNYNLYIGIPFCPTRCCYCSFTSFINCGQEKIEAYVDVLIKEINATIEMAKVKKLNLHSVYIGGGTPSVLDENQIDKLFSAIKSHYDLSCINEITFEAGRPDTITWEKLQCLKNNNVTRISINPQSMNEKTLFSMGRNHNQEDILEKYQMARKIGFDCINMDIILGLPGETEEDALNTIEKIVMLKPENITVHSLAYKKNAELTKESSEFLKDYNLMRLMHEQVRRSCTKNGYKPYYMYRQKNIKGNSENVGYCLTQKESIYNMIIIEELETILACGIGGSSKIMIGNNQHEPLRNFKSLEEYISRIDEILEKKRKLLK
ncbi:MAG: coproporphyrinogen dehydrogenase HemZ [Sedimentibacter sp.]|nr:coproporphyrinogen dehydrogenase HemZ [Sedimentibacter sp.]